MEYSSFHFAAAAWLWGLLVIPVAIILYALFYRPSNSHSRLGQFADRHLLPHLIVRQGSGAVRRIGTSLLLWSLLWACGILAMAQPHWNYTDLQTFKPQQDLVILLDLSKSMDAQDVKPSRLAVAREQIEDLIRQVPGMNIGLVAYAADAHMVSPITDDTKPILDLLPYLDTSLPYIQGNFLKPALSMASRMLGAEPGNNKSILIISDGGFKDNDITGMVTETVGKHTAIYTLGVGTEQGAPIATDKGGWVKDQDGKMVVSNLKTDKLRTLSNGHDGFYVQAGYTDDGIRAILNRIDSKDKAGEATGQTIRSWEEHFTILVFIMALLTLPWFRKGYIFPALAIMMALILPPGNANAAEWQDVFLNKQQQAQKIFNKGDYKGAEAAFGTSYRRGVAQYKAGKYAQAEKSFAQAQGVAPGARYNMGNAQTMQGKYDDAIASYESILKQDPGNRNARHNLEIARKLQQLQKQQQKDKNSDHKKEQQKTSQEKQASQQHTAGQSQSKEQQQGQNTGKENQGNDQQKQPSEQKSPGKQESPAQQAASNESPGSQEPNPGRSNADGQQGHGKQQNAAPQKPSPDKQEATAQSSASQVKEPPAPQAGQQNPAGTTSNVRNNPAAVLHLGAENKNGDGNADQKTSAVIARQEHPRTQKDVDADQWLNRIGNDPQSFLKNQFMIETKTDGTKQGEEPW